MKNLNVLSLLSSAALLGASLSGGELPGKVTFDDARDVAALHLENTNPENITVGVVAQPDGNRALRIDCKTGAGNLLFKPALRDWSKFSELRFKAHNIRNTFGYRIFSIKDAKGFKNPDGTNAMPHGYVQLQPNVTRDFTVELKKIPDLDLKNVEAFALIWGTPETGLELDDIRLLTAEEARREDQTAAQTAIQQLDAELRRTARAENADTLPEVRAVLDRLRALGERRPGREYRLAPEVDAANRLNALLLMRRRAGAADGRPAVLTADAVRKIFRESAFEPQSPVRLTTGRNDSESFQLVVLPAPDRPLSNVRLRASELRGAGGQPAIPRDRIDLQTVGYVQIADAFYYDLRNGWWPDPLFADRALPRLEGAFQPFRVTVNVPADTRSGLYHGEITVLADNAKPMTIPYQLEVRRFTLPTRGELVTYFDFRQQDNWTPEMRRKMYGLFLKHRLSPISMYGSATGAEKLIPHVDDWEFCRDNGQNNIVLWYLWNYGNSDPAVFDEKYLAKMRDSIAGYRSRLEALNMWDMTMISCCDEAMFDEPARRDFRIAQVRKACEFIKREIPGVRTSNIGPKLAIDENVMDSWFLLPEPAAVGDELRKKGKFTGIYWAYESPSFMLDMAGIAPRIAFWQAFKVGAQGAGYYSTLRPWKGRQYAGDAPAGVEYPLKDGYSLETYEGRRGRNGDGHIFYLNQDTSFTPSWRAANIRDGIEDYEYLALLRKLDKNKKYAHLLNIPDAIVSDPVNYWSNFDRDPRALYQHREAVSQALAELSADAQP